ncbi:MAG TPA: hypothetical protein P5556_00845 [Candidatus Gastranaerophilales bacterium]|nr:hypothetical protein [Candidatus Gastranaerophilales bacterium]
MTQEKTIETIYYQCSSQSLVYRELYILNNKKIKLEIKSDSYRNQCYARTYVLKDDEWNILYNVPYAEMETKEGLIYHHDYKKCPQKAHSEFRSDILRLKDLTKQLLS